MGMKGDQGMKGNDGQKGERGERGATGMQGIQGMQGMKGMKGNDGPKGEHGMKGDQGIQGMKGNDGPKGEHGQKGDQGIHGATGMKGDQGIQGMKGNDGQKGEVGQRGARGIQGIQGPQGPKGNDGQKGDQGPQGPKGNDGQKGDHGVQGPKGNDGQKGERGIQGPKGDHGLKGEHGNDGMGLKLKSFAIGQTYHIGEYVFSKSSKDNHDSMYIAEKAFVANKKPHLDLDSGNWVEFHAPRGVKGENGDRGLPGIAGEKGQKGEQGIAGPKGDKGNTGPRGADGKDADATLLKEQKTALTNVVKEAESKILAMVNKNIHAKNCSAGLRFDTMQELKQKKSVYCQDYGLDLAEDDVKNYAMVYIEKDDGRPEYDKFMKTISEHALFKVKGQCASPMFHGRDVSVQEIDGLTPGTKDWAFFMELDWESPNGCIKSELGKCYAAEGYLPKTSLRMQVYVDKANCCKDIKDYDLCSRTCELKPLDHHWRKEPLAFQMTVTGTQFKWQKSDFVLDGTEYTSPTKRNKLKIGENVNGGDITKAIEETEGSSASLIEVKRIHQNRVRGTSFDLQVEFELFKQNAQGACFGLGNAAELFKGIKIVDKQIQFSCNDSPKLCKCLSKSSSETNEAAIFKSENAAIVFKGNGDYTHYFIQHDHLPDDMVNTNGGGRRRRLLSGMMQRSGQGGC